MNNFSDHISAMEIAYLLVDKDLSILEISHQAEVLLRVGKGQRLVDCSVSFVDEDYYPRDVLKEVQSSVDSHTELNIELGINYPTEMLSGRSCS